MDRKERKELMGQPYIREQDITVAELITQYIAKLGENIKLGEFSRLQI